MPSSIILNLVLLSIWFSYAADASFAPTTTLHRSTLSAYSRGNWRWSGRLMNKNQEDNTFILSGSRNETERATTSNLFSRPTSNPKNPSDLHFDVEHSNGNKYHKAIHQVEHRAKEKAAFGLAERVTEQVAKVSESVVERAGERLGERLGDHAIENVGERMIEHAAENMIAETAGRKSVERVAERLTERIGERTSEKITERLGENIGGKVFKKSATEFSQKATERVLEQASEKTLERTGKVVISERITERVVEGAGERIIEHAGADIAAKTGERLIEHAAVRTSETTGERLLETAGKSFASKSIEVGERTLERSGEKAVVRAMERSSEISIVRFTKGIMIALPAIGGLFALYLLKSDIQKMKEEWADKVKPSFSLFVGAGIADFVDSLLHFFIFYGLCVGLNHHRLVVAEELSMTCAIASTLFAVTAEVLGHKIRTKRRNDKAALS